MIRSPRGVFNRRLLRCSKRDNLLPGDDGVAAKQSDDREIARIASRKTVGQSSCT